jgi:cytochrome P450
MIATVARSAIDPFDAAFLTNPYPFFEELREAGPVVYLELYGVWVLTRHAECAVSTFPDEWQKLRCNPARIRGAIEEVCRFESPVQTFFRTRTVEIAGITIPEGEKVLVFLASASPSFLRTAGRSCDLTIRFGGLELPLLLSA